MLFILFLAKHTLMDCKVMGCNGKGNTNDSSTFEHTAVKDCPYEMDSWKIAVAGLGKLPDRLKSEKILPNIVSAVTRFYCIMLLKKCLII